MQGGRFSISAFWLAKSGGKNQLFYFCCSNKEQPKPVSFALRLSFGEHWNVRHVPKTSFRYLCQFKENLVLDPSYRLFAFYKRPENDERRKKVLASLCDTITA
jgi:hypothetical protein